MSLHKLYSMKPLRSGLLELGNATESKFLKFQLYSAFGVFRIKKITKNQLKPKVFNQFGFSLSNTSEPIQFEPNNNLNIILLII